uniref:Uncharacterized protein n=1 Tax=Peronospora matthiolae TaxID=2874970 RepID=A0AAV1UR31_9STRA
MIIRAVSDSDSDDELYSAPAGASATPRSVFDAPDLATVSRTSAGVRYAWFAACGAAVLLLFIDVAAFLNPSQDASILNQFVGLGLAGAWIFSREQNLAAAGHSNTVQWRGSARYGVWTVTALLCLGHVVSCLYVLFALLESNGDHVKFWLGQRRSKSKHLAAHYGRP